MGAEAEVIVQQNIVDIKPPESTAMLQYIPSIRSASFSDIGPRRYMEDEHIRIDDLSMQLGPLFRFPKPSAFYGVFDGHGGPEAAAYVKKNVMRLLFEDVNFPHTCEEVDDSILLEVEKCVRSAYLLADVALADECSVSSSSGTTALTALVLGRLLMVANAGDCRAVICRKGEAMDMSQDHRPTYGLERRRVEELGGFIDDGYLNGVLSVTRALGDWDMKKVGRGGGASALIAEPEFRQIVLTEEDEFMIIGCDGIWDVMSSQHAVSLVRRGLRRHDDPEKCARELVTEALRLNTFDNLTVIVVCFTSNTDQQQQQQQQQRKLRYCSLSAEALCSLRSLLDMSQDHRPTYGLERRRVEELGGFIDDGYLNGVLSVTRALGDWDMKKVGRGGGASALIAEPEFRQIVLTEEDEFMIIGCDGIWDVMSSQHAVSLVRRGLRRHDDPEKCARELVTEALRLNTFDNLTVIVVCFTSNTDQQQQQQQQQRKLRYCSLSAEALCSLRSLLDGNGSH